MLVQPNSQQSYPTHAIVAGLCILSGLQGCCSRRRHRLTKCYRSWR